MSGDQTVRVLIAHQNQLIAAGLAAAFRAEEGFRLVEAAALERDAPDAGCVTVAVMDCEAGLRFMARAQPGGHRLLILTDDYSEISIRRAVELGIHGYLPLSSRIESVVRAVRSIRRGGTAIAPIVMEKMSLSLRSRRLTERETDVLRLIMRGLPDKSIARQLKRSVGTAKAHVKAILTKLEAANRAEAIVVARRRGLIRDDPESLSEQRSTSCIGRGQPILR